MLLYADIQVFTDHKYLSFDTLKTQCVLRWHKKIEEFLLILYTILCWECWMSACQSKGQKDRHVFVRPTCHQHVGQHVGDMT
jgi:hypothetical protein